MGNGYSWMQITVVLLRQDSASQTSAGLLVMVRPTGPANYFCFVPHKLEGQTWNKDFDASLKGIKMCLKAYHPQSFWMLVPVGDEGEGLKNICTLGLTISKAISAGIYILAKNMEGEGIDWCYSVC